MTVPNLYVLRDDRYFSPRYRNERFYQNNRYADHKEFISYKVDFFL